MSPHQHQQQPQHEQKTLTLTTTHIAQHVFVIDVNCHPVHAHANTRHVVECVCNICRAPGANRPESQTHTHMHVRRRLRLKMSQHKSRTHIHIRTHTPMRVWCDAIPRIYPTAPTANTQNKKTPATTTNYSPYRLRSRRRLTHAAVL